MATNNISTLTQSNILRSRMLAIQLEMARAQLQVATGKKSDLYGDLRADARLSISLNNTKTTVDMYQKTIAITKMRMESTEGVLGRVSDIATDIRSQTMIVLSTVPDASGSTSATLKLVAQNMLQEIASLLNVKVDGRFLFSGLDVSTPPMIPPGEVGAVGTPLDTVATGAPALAGTAASGADRYTRIAGTTGALAGPALAGATTINVAGPPGGVVPGMEVTFPNDPTPYTITAVGAGTITINASPPLPPGGLTAPLTGTETVTYHGYISAERPAFYYQADTTPGAAVSARIADGFDLEYGIRGDDPGFATVMKALYALATADFTSANEAGYRELAQRAITDLQTGYNQIQQATGVLGVRQSILEQTDERHSDFVVTLSKQISNIEDVDAAEALTRLQMLQGTLEVSYKLLATARQSSLIDFL